MARKRRFRLPFVRHPHDASREFDDASYDGGVSGGAYLRHVIVVVVLIAIVAAIVRWVI